MQLLRREPRLHSRATTLATTDVLIGRIESLIRETGQTGFHFVDEAAPPKALKSLANALLQRKLDISWWGNIRFEKSSMPPLPTAGRKRLHRRHGGLEVASDRLLKLMKKGVSVGQVARVTRASPTRESSYTRISCTASPLNRARHRRRPGIRPPAVRGRLHTIGFLPSLHLHRAFAGRQHIRNSTA